ncbi:MAG: hypothetical protein WC613_02840 [Candidatus Aenigmatarchaeota archaeon]
MQTPNVEIIDISQDRVSPEYLMQAERRRDVDLMVFVARGTSYQDAEDSLRHMSINENPITKALFPRARERFEHLTTFRSYHYPQDAVLPPYYDYLLARPDGILEATAAALPYEPLCADGGDGYRELSDIVGEAKKVATQNSCNVVFITPFWTRGSEVRTDCFGHRINSGVQFDKHVNCVGDPYCYQGSRVMFELMKSEPQS